MSKIEWCDLTWNPVWGCFTGCDYCYARKIAKRFYKKITQRELKNGFINSDNHLKKLHNFSPVWLESNFQRNFPKKPSRIFVNSMSDIHWWDDRWIDRVVSKIKKYPQHTFIFLTKFYYSSKFPPNCWLGWTVTNEKELRDKGGTHGDIIRHPNKTFLSIEPISGDIGIEFGNIVDWVIVGAETGNRKGKVIPEKEWIYKIEDHCKRHKIPLFQKNNLKGLLGYVIQEFPEQKNFEEK
jgi:protein gp37